jgi:hypothetical protein
MAKKNSFLDAVDDLTFNPKKIEGIEIGENYSQSVSQKTEKSKNLNQIEESNKANEAPNKPVEQLSTKIKVDKPRQVKLKPKIVNKPIKTEINRENRVFNDKLPIDVDLSFLKGLNYDAKIGYLASNGFWIQLERFKGIYWEVALKYINKKKYRVYIKELAGIPNYDDYSKVDMLKIRDMTATERRVYLCKRGWSIKVMLRGNAEYEYATKYINRKKKHIYIGAYIPGSEQQIFV